MKLKGWLAFILVQVVALSTESIGSPLPAKIVGMILLLPSSGFLYLFGGERLAAMVMKNTASEITANVIFFSVNALAWVLVARLLHRRSSTAHQY